MNESTDKVIEMLKSGKEVKAVAEKLKMTTSNVYRIRKEHVEGKKRKRDAAKKRGPGRPKGSKNKTEPKLEVSLNGAAILVAIDSEVAAYEAMLKPLRKLRIEAEKILKG